ncbi:lysine biosynthesis protein LysX [Paenibacillus nicotianae]|uniref:Lysine biosynthesis protein LysX n=1 Tax=Paenibacillus nicotianae TaxID=1526551 RepID=A0ABW4UU43_9BACL
MEKHKLAICASKIRKEEKDIFLCLEKRKISYDYIDSGKVKFHLYNNHSLSPYRAVLNRCISYYTSLYAMQCFESQGLLTVNHSSIIDLCGDKLKTSVVLSKHNIATPKTAVAFDYDSALELIEEIGYPVVIKPIVGSWGRLLAKISDRYAAESILEHKKVLGSPIHHIFYIQEFMQKPDRDIRILVAGNEIIGSMYRRSNHWITNTARDAIPEACQLTEDMIRLTKACIEVVGEGLLAIDLIENQHGELFVNEINPTMEFKGMEQATDINIADHIVDYLIKVCDS